MIWAGMFIWGLFGGFNFGMTFESKFGPANGRWIEPMALFLFGPIGTTIIVGYINAKS